ncbi:hypothetical protein E2C01_084078 [Portunus trituberculatus]|uniref:Uncharacterized protein n=1 Tax=Portunus trituberculatus TaxID=210409 RepID=A0A5B7J323_PORTR|nr:hypothetical protein [Portunus trituberculatus]
MSYLKETVLTSAVEVLLPWCCVNVGAILGRTVGGEDEEKEEEEEEDEEQEEEEEEERKKRKGVLVHLETCSGIWF